MKTFALELINSLQSQTFGNVTHFIGADNSGSFGILAGHAPLVAVLRYGLARFLDENGSWLYVALPGGVLRFTKNRLTVTSAHYFLGADRDKLAQQLAEAMQAEDLDVHNARATLARIDQALMRRLAELGQTESDRWAR